MTHRFDRFGNLVELVRPGWREVVAATAPPTAWHGMNDPRFTAVGSFGCHLYRPPRDGETELWQHSRHVETLRGDSWGVVKNGMHGDCALGESYPLLHVFREWTINPPIYKCEGSVRVLPAAAGWFIKEPKVGVGSFVDLANALTVMDKGGRGLKGWIAKGAGQGPRYDLTTLVDPQRRTAQITHPDRRRFLLRGPNGRVTVSLQTEFRSWKNRSRNRARVTLADGPVYCYANTLRESTELIRRPHSASLLETGWSAGTGFDDCPGCYRALVPGESYRWWLRLRVGK